MKKPSGSDQRRKRAVNVCQRCRWRKIKCSGTQPCEGCSQRSLECLFEPEGRKFLVPERYLQELKRKAEFHDGDCGQRHSKSARATSPSDHSGDNETDEQEVPSQIEAQTSPFVENALHFDSQAVSREHSPSPEYAPIPLSNPLTSEELAYVKDNEGRPRFLGHSSTWSFSQRMLNLFRETLSQSEYPDTPINFDSSTYSLDWGNSPIPDPPDTNGLPSLDYALYLTNTVKFHICQTFYLFDEDEFTRNLHAFYTTPAEKAQKSRMWFIQYLLVIAFGKAFLQQAKTVVPPGSEYFLRAMTILPNTERLYNEPVAIEVLSMVSLYLQCVDMRCSAYSYIGQALRIAVTQGMHREIPVEDFDSSVSQRWRNIWWTVYILNRRFSSMMGNPPSIQDEDITVHLPPHRDSIYRAATLSLNVELSRVIARVLNTVYGSSGRLDSAFLTCTHSVLKIMTDLALKLEDASQLMLKGPCIVLALRPLVLCLLGNAIDASFGEISRPLRRLADPVQALLQTCIDSATKILEILLWLQENGLLEHFLPFDLENAFSSAFILTVVTVVLPGAERVRIMVQGRSVHDAANSILEDMIVHGSVPAKLRRAELVQLEQMVTSFFNMKPEALTLQSNTMSSHPRNVDQPLRVHVMGGEDQRCSYWTSQSRHVYLPEEIDSMVQGLEVYSTANVDLTPIDQWLWTDMDI